MKAREAQIAASTMFDMATAIEEKDREKFRVCLNDTRILNCIVGNQELTQQYVNLCVKALKVFV